MTAETRETVTAVLVPCNHLVPVPAGTGLPDVAECPRCDREREIGRFFGEDES